MSRKILLAALTFALLPALAGTAAATTVYRTKNADGTNSYSQVETRGAEARTINSAEPKPGDAAPTGRAKTPDEQFCERAKLNLQLLASDQSLQVDRDGDGVPETLSAEDRAAQRALAQSQADAYCGTGGGDAPAAPAAAEAGGAAES